MGEQLTGTVQHIATLWPDAVYVIAYFRETAVFEGADFVFHKLLKPISRQLLIFDVVRLMFFWKRIGKLLKKNNYIIHG